MSFICHDFLVIIEFYIKITKSKNHIKIDKLYTNSQKNPVFCFIQIVTTKWFSIYLKIQTQKKL